MEEKIIFDCTNVEFYRGSYVAFNSKQRKSYQVGQVEHGKIKIIITNVEDVTAEFIFWFKSKEEIYDLITARQPLTLYGTYVKDFDISEIDNHQHYKLKDFDAIYSFWDGEVSFVGAIYEDGDISFEGANFGDGGVSFDYARFGNGDVSFWGVNFADASISFSETKFGDGNISFGYAYFGYSSISFFGTDFGNSSISFFKSNFGSGGVLFWGIDFAVRDVSFYGALIEKLEFYGVKFHSHVGLILGKVNKLSLENCIIEKTMKCAFPDCTQLSFLDTVNLGQIYIDWEKDNLLHSITNGVVKDSYWDGRESIERNFTSDELASQFRMLKENFHNIGYYNDEDKAYYAYMHYKRLALKDDQPKGFKAKSRNRFRRAFYCLFEKIGGFGTKPLSILAWAAGFIVGFGLLQAVFMDAASVWMKLLKGCYFSTITFFTIGYGDVLPANAWSAVLSGAEGFVGVVTMSYFTVALVRKLLR